MTQEGLISGGKWLRCEIYGLCPFWDVEFQGTKWRLYSDRRGDPSLGIKKLCDTMQFKPFSVVVRVEDSSKDGIPTFFSSLARKTHVVKLKEETTPRKQVEIWKCRREYVESLPVLRFLVTFEPDDFTNTSSAGRSTQTHCVLSEGTSQINNLPSSTTASVQTTWRSSSYPCLESLSHDLTQLLDQGSKPDVEFICGDHSVKAHRLIVCARSPVIASMLHSDMVENKTGVVNILNMVPDVLTQFLKYLYTGQLDPLTFDAAMSLYEAGDQYAVHGLARRCSKFLMENLTVENACEVLVVADAHSDADFKEAVVGFMLEKQIPLSGDRWQDFCVSHSVIANEVLNRFCKNLSKAQAASNHPYKHRLCEKLSKAQAASNHPYKHRQHICRSKSGWRII